jgi:hypothetical protein
VAKIVSLVVLGVGLALMAMMIVVEGEPGALPLALVVIGLVGYFVARARGRSQSR